MKQKIAVFVRYAYQGHSFYGRLDGQTIHELAGPPFDGAAPTGRRVSLSDARLLAPCEPTKIIAVGRNYRSHLDGREAPAEPGLFAKFPSCVIGPGDAIVFPPGATDVHYEGEMVVVMGRQARHLPPGRAADYIFGVTAGNDVSERVWQKHDMQWLRAKSSDTFGPIGPAIVQGLDWNDLQVQTRLNGEVRQSQRTRDLIFSVDTIVTYASRFCTLLPGDLIFTGTPGTTAPMRPGDVVEIEVEGVGVLRNPVAAHR